MAGFLMHFALFVEWPNKNSINICIVGEDPFGTFFDKMLLSKQTNRSAKKISLSRLKVGQRIEKCHIIFSTKRSTTAQFWQNIPQKHSILLVSEFDQFTKLGGLINFYTENKRIRIEINIDAVNKAGIKISSELLKLSKISHYKVNETTHDKNN
tara:strand:+ start:1045 stop:1506 length:462 start_codon:yes stop_codon:yes gene_type:complete